MVPRPRTASSRCDAVDRKGNDVMLSNADMGYSYRHSQAPEGLIFTPCHFRGVCRGQGEDPHRDGRGAPPSRDGAADP